MSKRMTHDEFVQRVLEVLGPDYEVLSTFEKQEKEVEILHKICGKTRKVKPREILRTKKGKNGERIPNPTRCKFCYGNMPHTLEEFKDYVDRTNKREGTKLEILSDKYTNNKVKLDFICHECNNIVEFSWNGFVNRGYRCDHTGKKHKGGNVSMTLEQFKRIVSNINKKENENYEVVDTEFKSYTEGIKIKHNKCGKEYTVTPENFIMGRRCRTCKMELRKVSLDEFKRRVFEAEGNNYTVIGPYRLQEDGSYLVLEGENPLNNKEPIMVRHNCDKCNNNEWPISIANFDRNHRCPICAYLDESEGEKEIRKYIETLTECHDKHYSRGILDGKDIDILTMNDIGFEYNGEYWHQEVENPTNSWEKPIGYHKNKIKLAKSKGIILYHIWERHWKSRPEDVKKFIKNAIKKK